MANVKRTKRRYGADYGVSYVEPGYPPYNQNGERGITRENIVYTEDSPKDWRHRILTGQDATSVLVGTGTTIKNDRGFIQATGKKPPVLGHTWTSRGRITPHVSGLLHPDVVPHPDADNRAATELLSSYRDAVSAFQGANFAAEFLECVTLFTSPLKSIFGKSVGLANAIGKAKGVAYSNPRRYAQKISSAYLGYQFAVAPLAADLSAAASGFQQFMENRIKVKGISGKGSAEEEIESSVKTHPDMGALAIQSYQCMKLSQVRYHGKVGMSFSGMGSLMAQMGFSAPDIVPSVWEAVPFSFLIDYFTNVSETLARLSIGETYPYLRYVAKGTKNSIITMGSAFSPQSDKYWDVVASGFSSRCEEWTVSRSSGYELPPVRIQYQLPSVKQGFNIAALVAAIAASEPSRQF